MFEVRPVDVDGLISVYYGAQDRRARQIAYQKEMERQDRKDQKDRDFEDAYGRFVGSGGLAGAYSSSPRDGGLFSGDTNKILASPNRASDPVSFATGGMAGAYQGLRNGAANGLAAIFANRPSPQGAPPASSPIGGLPARPQPSPLRQVDPSAVMDGGGIAPSLSDGSTDPRRHMMSEDGPENLLPPEIQRMANSPNMDDRNAAFMEMARIDPIRAFKIQSEMRDAALDRLKGGQDALRIAASRLASTNDDNSYRAVLSELDAQLMPLGIDISKTVPPTHPGPEGIRKLQMLAMKEAEQLAAIDREARTEAMIENYDADNERQDRDLDSRISDREARTDIARDRATIYRQREDRIGSGGGKPPVKARPTERTAVNPKTGERMVLRDGKWIPAKGDASGNAGGGFR